MKQFPTHIVAAEGIVQNRQNEILLVKNRRQGIWTTPGGQVETGETLIDALIREIKEESGVDAAVDKLVCVSSNIRVNPGFGGFGIVPTKVILTFACTYTGGELCDSDETSESRWVSKDRVLEFITSPAFVERYTAYANFKGDTQYLAYTTKPVYDLKLKRLI